MILFFWLAVLTLIALFVFGLQGLTGARRIEWLDHVKVLADSFPKVSVIVPALNEEENIREALASVMSLDYPGLEIIVVNDRSTDRTGDILEQMSRQQDFPLKVFHLEKLTPGWLGKNHALHYGASQASGEYLLFTDADVVMEDSTLKKAMTRMLDRKLDHLTLFFKAVLPSSLLQMVVIEFGVSLVSYLKPWKAADPEAKNAIGIGAFNLVKASSYREIGGHEAIKLCPLDDIMLGSLIKRHHLRQECLYGYRFISVKWYGSVREMISGLQKNTYAALDYSFARLCFLTLAQLVVSIWPFWALFLTDGATYRLYLVIIFLQGCFFALAASYSDISVRHIIWFPLTPYIRIYMTWKAVLFTIFQGGIYWRGTFYSLRELKAGRFISLTQRGFQVNRDE